MGWEYFGKMGRHDSEAHHAPGPSTPKGCDSTARTRRAALYVSTVFIRYGTTVPDRGGQTACTVRYFFPEFSAPLVGKRSSESLSARSLFYPAKRGNFIYFPVVGDSISGPARSSTEPGVEILFLRGGLGLWILFPAGCPLSEIRVSASGRLVGENRSVRVRSGQFYYRLSVASSFFPFLEFGPFRRNLTQTREPFNDYCGKTSETCRVQKF